MDREETSLTLISNPWGIIANEASAYNLVGTFESPNLVSSNVASSFVPIWQTPVYASFIEPLENRMLKIENRALKYILINQWRAYKYNQEYIQFLLGGYTDEEFTSIAEQFALPFNHISQSDLRFMALVILKTLTDTVTAGDLSFLLNVDPADARTALSSYSRA